MKLIENWNPIAKIIVGSVISIGGIIICSIGGATVGDGVGDKLILGK